MADSPKKSDTQTTKGSYSSPYANLQAVWAAMMKHHATEDNPMTLSDIAKALHDGLEDEDDQRMVQLPSRSTLGRIIPAERRAFGQLFPCTLSEEGDPTAVTSYTHEDELHIVVENRVGEALVKGKLKPEKFRAELSSPSYSTVDKLLKKMLSIEPDPRLNSLNCDGVTSQDGAVSYQDLTMEKREQQLQAGKPENARLANNVPRRYYLSSPLSPAEWQLLADMIQVYPFLNKAQTSKYLNVLKSLNPASMPTSYSRYAWKSPYGQIGTVINVLDDAIRSHQRVKLEYGAWTLVRQSDGRWKPELKKREHHGELEVVPYALIWSNGNYYLVCRHQGMMNLRVDRIIRINVPEQPREERKANEAETHDFNAAEYRNSCPVMYPGEKTLVRLRCQTSMVNVLLDFFGDIPQYGSPRDGTVEVSMSIAPAGVKLFALQYADSVEVLEPLSLRQEIRDTLTAALKKYDS